jgi:hypothetical protein
MTAADWEGIAAIVTAVLTGVPAIIIALRSSSAAKAARIALNMHNDNHPGPRGVYKKQAGQ